MRYSSLGGGKRLRAQLVYASGGAAGAQLIALDRAAAAVEMVHAYSLIHDDLPAMDDDHLRRGRPTCHIEFGEATAILAGDALQALAFEVLAADPASNAQLLLELAIACGSRGMAGGQALDLAAVGQPLDLAQLETMHVLKTGALIRASVRLGALIAGIADARALAALSDFGHHLGLAFQIHDDVLDVIGCPQALGKSVGKDAADHKPTYPGICGLRQAQALARQHHAQARAALANFSGEQRELLQLLDYTVEREN